jgi:pimeloyl-ACP methyl ester carboxylesterase
LVNTAMRSDFLFWAATRLARRTVIGFILATPPEVVEHASASEQQRVQRTLEHILPVSPRRVGLLNDGSITTTLPRYDLERIATSTLLISCKDDLFGTYDVAAYTAARIPRARLLGYPSGGHLWVGHAEEVTAEISGFLSKAFDAER